MLPLRRLTLAPKQETKPSPQPRKFSPEFTRMMTDPQLRDQNRLKAVESAREENRSLTWKQRRFIAEYLSDPGRNAFSAAKRAGYKSAYDPSGLLRHPQIKGIIDAENRKVFQQLEITPEAVLQHTAALAFSNLLDYVDENGKLDLSKLSAGQGLAIQELSIENGKPRIKLADKLTALTLLGKHFKLFEDSKIQSNTQISVSIFDKLLSVNGRIECP